MCNYLKCIETIGNIVTKKVKNQQWYLKINKQAFKTKKTY